MSGGRQRPSRPSSRRQGPLPHEGDGPTPSAHPRGGGDPLPPFVPTEVGTQAGCSPPPPGGVGSLSRSSPRKRGSSFHPLDQLQLRDYSPSHVSPPPHPRRRRSMVSIRRRVGMRVAAGLPLKPAAMAERLSEVEADALLDDAEFQGLVEGYRRFMDLPAAERRERLVAIAFCELEAAALDGDIKVCCFLLKEDRLRRCPAETLADALEARMAPCRQPPPAPRPGGVGPRSQPRRGPPLVRRGRRPHRRRDAGRPRRRTPPPGPDAPVRQPRTRQPKTPQVEPQAPAAPTATGRADPVPSPPRRCSVASSSAAPPAWRSAPTRTPGTSMLTAPVPPVAAPGAPKPRRVSRHPRPSVLSLLR